MPKKKKKLRLGEASPKDPQKTSPAQPGHPDCSLGPPVGVGMYYLL